LGHGGGKVHGWNLDKFMKNQCWLGQHAQ
jgi:hypothetical protein